MKKIKKVNKTAIIIAFIGILTAYPAMRLFIIQKKAFAITAAVNAPAAASPADSSDSVQTASVSAAYSAAAAFVSAASATNGKIKKPDIYANGKIIPVSAQAEPAYKKALSLYKANDIIDAYNETKFILDNYEMGKTLNCNVNFLMGRVLYKMNYFFGAKPYFQAIIHSDPDYKDIYRVIFYMAKCDFNMKNYRRSIRDFYYLSKKTGKGSELYDKSLAYLAMSYASCGRNAEADKILNNPDAKKILKNLLFIGKRETYFKLVYLSYLINHKKDFAGAISLLAYEKLFVSPDNNKCYKPYFYGEIALGKKEYGKASGFFANSSNYCKERYYRKSLLYYGISSAGLNNYPDAVKYIKMSMDNIDFPKTRLKAMESLADIYASTKKPDYEIKAIKRILFDYPYLPETENAEWQKKGAGLLNSIVKKDYGNKEYDKALKSVRRIEFLLSKQYINPETYFYLAKIEQDKNDIKKALVYAKKYNDTSKTSDSAYFLADAYYKNKEYKESLGELNTINEKSLNGNELAQKITGLKLRLYKLLETPKNYINLLKSSLNSIPLSERMKSVFFLGKHEYNSGNLKPAGNYFNMVVSQGKHGDGNEAELYGAYYYLGLINYSYRNYKASLEYFKKGYELNPSGKNFEYELSQIAYIYLKFLNNRKEALKYYGLLEQKASSDTYKTLASSMIAAINMQK